MDPLKVFTNESLEENKRPKKWSVKETFNWLQDSVGRTHSLQNYQATLQHSKPRVLLYSGQSETSTT